MARAKSNRELYHEYTVLAPSLLARVSRLLVLCRSAGIAVPKGIRNIFEFTWDELVTDPSVPTASDIHGLEISIGAPPAEPPLSQRRPGPTPAPTPPPLPAAAPAPVPSRHWASPGHLAAGNQETLQRFQCRSVHLLTELLNLKMKAMLESVTGANPLDITRRFLEASQLLHVSAKEVAFQHLLGTANKELGQNWKDSLTSFSAMGVNSPYQLVYESTTGCLSFSLSTSKDSKRKPGKLKTTDEPDHQVAQAGTSATEVLSFTDPCPEARERLQKLRRQIEAERALSTGRPSYPVVLRNYRAKSGGPQGPPSAGLQSPARPGLQSPLPGQLGLPGAKRPSKDWKGTRRYVKLHYSFHDGSSFVYYPSGNIATCQIPTCCRGRPITCLFSDSPRLSFLALFTAEGLGCVHYNIRTRCPYVLVLDEEGGTTNDYKGYVVHKWSWASKAETLLSLEYKVNEEMKLTVLGQDSIVVTFTSMHETVTIPVSPSNCPHGQDKRASRRIGSMDDRLSKVSRAMAIKKRFQKTVSQFMNCILLVAGLLTIEYPLPEEPEPSRTRGKPAALPERGTKVSESTAEVPTRSPSRIGFSMTMTEDDWREDRASVHASPSRRRVGLIRHSAKTRARPAGTTRSPSRWAASPCDCPLVLRRLLLREDMRVGCRCLLHPPALSDVELERFLAAPRDPLQVLVLGVLGSRDALSKQLSAILDGLYAKGQQGRGQPCLQSRHDPFRLLRYELEGPQQKAPPLLVQRFAAVQGMILMFSAGKLLFGGCILNGYGYSRQNLLKQIFRARQDSKQGHFLPEDFKFSIQAPSPTQEETRPTKRTLSDDMQGSLSSLGLLDRPSSPETEWRLKPQEADVWPMNRARRGSKKLTRWKRTAKKQ